MKVLNQFLLFFGVLLILGTALFIVSDSYVPYELNYQVNAMIKNHEHTKLTQVAQSKKTSRFLNNLNSHTRCKDTSDFQGGNSTHGFYATDLNGKTVGVEMKKSGLLNWRVSKIFQ